MGGGSSRDEQTAAPRPLTMQDRLLVVAHITSLTISDPTLAPIKHSIIESSRCCDGFPKCAHVDDEAARVTVEEAEEILRDA